MGYFLVALSAVTVFAIAAFTVGRESRRLDMTQPNPIIDVDDSVVWIADRLAPQAQARLSHEEVRTIVHWQLDHFSQMGVAPSARPADLSLKADSPLDDDPAVIGDVDSLAFVLTRAEQGDYDINADDANAVLELHLAYLQEHGAITPAQNAGD